MNELQSSVLVILFYVYVISVRFAIPIQIILCCNVKRLIIRAIPMLFYVIHALTALAVLFFNMPVASVVFAFDGIMLMICTVIFAIFTLIDDLISEQNEE